MRHYLPFCTVLTFSLMMQKAWWGKPTVPQQESRQWYQGGYSPVIFPITHSQLFKKPVSLKNDLDEAVKIINFVKSQSLALNLFNLLCDTMGSTRGALLPHTEAQRSPLGKTHLCMFELWDELLPFFMDCYFYSKEQLTNYD